MGPWPNDPLGPQARSAADIYWIMFVAAVIVLVIVDGGLVYAGLKFRDRPGHVAKQFHGHNVLELLWTVIPRFMVLSFSVLSFQQLMQMHDFGNPGMVVKVKGHDLDLTFGCPLEGCFNLID